MISLMQASLLVLAGGASRRMGRPKAWLEVGDTYLLRYVAERLAPAFSEVMVSFAEPEQLQDPVPYRVVFDPRPSAAPTAQLHATRGLAPHSMRIPDAPTTSLPSHSILPRAVLLDTHAPDPHCA